MLHILGGCPIASSLCSLLLPPRADCFALSSSFVLACTRNDGFHSSARAAKSPQVASDPVGIGDSHPLRSTLIDVCLHRHQWHSSEPESPIPIARSNTIVLCKGNHIKIPKYSNTKNSNENPHILENGPIPPH